MALFFIILINKYKFFHKKISYTKLILTKILNNRLYAGSNLEKPAVKEHFELDYNSAN